MSVHGGVVRDDRTWPRRSGAFSLLVVLGALGAGGWAVATAGHDEAGPVPVAGAFAVALVASLLLFHRAFAALLAGGRQPAWSVAAQLVFIVGGFVTLSYDLRFGMALLAGMFAGMFAVNLWAIRRGRSNRKLVDAAEAEAETARAARSRDAEAAREAPVRDSQPAVDVGGTLDTAWRDAWQRWVAWLVAGVVVTIGARLLTASELAALMIPFMSVLVLLWVSRAAVSVGLARRDFRLARTPPERAWVVLLNDPTPRMVRPLLGVWSEEPVVRESVFPRPELVFRCDDDLDDLLSYQGGVEVHEAWVDTSARGMRGARWVAADGGVALPHRRAFLGRWFFSSLTRAERPPPARPLHTAQPDPAAPRGPAAAPSPGLPGLAKKVGWRVAALAALAVGSVLID